MGMSATRQRCFPCSAWGWRFGRSIPFNSPTIPGYGAWQGQTFTGEAIRALIDGIAARGVMPECEAVLSGYLGDAAIGEAVLHAVDTVRAANPSALYCCDPVIGDVAPGVYVRPGIPEFLRHHCLPAADIATPNQFELEHLTGHRISTLDTARAAIGALRATMRPGGVVLVTSVRTEETPAEMIDLLAADDAALYRVRTPTLPIAANGAGDTIAALFLLHRLRTGDTAKALAAAASAVFSLLHYTAQAGSRELLTIAGQRELVSPSPLVLC